MAITLQRLPQVLAARGIGRSQHYQDVRDGLWTSPVRMGSQCSAWPAHETEALNAARVAGLSDERIRELVQQLHAQRKADFEVIGSRYLSQAAASAA